MSFKYECSQNWDITLCKAIFAVCREKIQPNIHFDPSATAAHTAYTAYTYHRATNRLILAIAAANKMHFRHCNISSSFTSEKNKYDKLVYVRQLSCFDGTLTHPPEPVCILHLNQYGSCPTYRIYLDGVDRGTLHAGLHPHSQRPLPLYWPPTSRNNISSIVLD